jgi:hypothetical protein
VHLEIRGSLLEFACSDEVASCLEYGYLRACVRVGLWRRDDDDDDDDRGRNGVCGVCCRGSVRCALGVGSVA